MRTEAYKDRIRGIHDLVEVCARNGAVNALPFIISHYIAEVGLAKPEEIEKPLVPTWKSVFPGTSL